MVYTRERFDETNSNSGTNKVSNGTKGSKGLPENRDVALYIYAGTTLSNP